MPDPKIPLAQHEADARLATPWPWRKVMFQGRHYVWHDEHELGPLGSIFEVCEEVDGDGQNTKHIANCDPQTMAAFYRVVRAAAKHGVEHSSSDCYGPDGCTCGAIELSDALEAFDL